MIWKIRNWFWMPVQPCSQQMLTGWWGKHLPTCANKIKNRGYKSCNKDNVRKLPRSISVYCVTWKRWRNNQTTLPVVVGTLKISAFLNEQSKGYGWPDLPKTYFACSSLEESRLVKLDTNRYLKSMVSEGMRYVSYINVIGGTNLPHTKIKAKL